MTLAALALIAAMGFSFYGWGWGLRRLFGMAAGSWPVTVCLGVAMVVFVGGIVNDVSLATPAALVLVLLAGAGLAITAAKHRFHTPRALLRATAEALAAERWMLIVSIGLPLAFAGIAAALLLPPSAYNYGDDFQKYFAYPVRMLQTGTLSGSALNSMGAETLGGQSVLDGFAVAALPITYVNVGDTIFGFALCLFLAAGTAARRKSLAIAGVLCVLGAAFINPQLVNISSLYLGAALMAAAVALAADPREAPKPAALGLIYAALIAMKPTFALFVVLHGAFTAVALGATTRRIKSGAAWLAATSAYSLAFLSPWLLLNASHYITALTSPVAHDVVVPKPMPEVFNPFSAKRTSYDAAMLEYTVAGASAAISAGLAWWTARKEQARTAAATLAAGLALIAAYGLMLVIGGPMLAGYYMALRYFTPFAIGIIPMVCGFSAALTDASKNAHPIQRRWLPLVFALVPVAVFAPSFAARCEQAWQVHHVLAFSEVASAPGYLAYNRDVLSGEAPERVKTLQNLVPAGEPILAWINQPFLLDYDRNPITDVNTAGLVAPWAELPKTDYVIWEYLGYASPRFAPDYDRISEIGKHEWMISARALEFAQRLRALSKRAGPLYNDGHIAVFKLNPAPDAP